MKTLSRASTLAVSALLVLSTSSFADTLGQSSTIESAEQKKSQLQEQKVGFCWIWTGTHWIYIC